ncbi:MAG: tetratricopeptide repeat protein [Chitinophagaceae bacterium]|nr:MAG: tetratricopeptide repeat protein [Chitinophagaceae bacterium]
MKKTQWTVLGIVALLTTGLYLGTQSQIFGVKAPKSGAESTVHAAGDGHGPNDGHDHGPNDGHDHGSATVTSDTVLARARQRLNDGQRTRLTLLENSISRGDVQEQKAHLYHQLAAFWRDSARLFEPFAWYTAEAARLENSEKSLTFAARLFLDNLRGEEDPALKQWKASQAKDLFERSLNRNPSNDSAQVGLGATILYGGTESPMEGIGKIRAVADRDSNFAYAQQVLGEASLLSNQPDKAVERFQRVVRLQPDNLSALLLLADIEERRGNKAAAQHWYGKSLPLIGNDALRREVEKRMAELSK